MVAERQQVCSETEKLQSAVKRKPTMFAADPGVDGVRRAGVGDSHISK